MDISGVKYLKLVVVCGGDSHASSGCVWADASLYSTTGEPTLPTEPETEPTTKPTTKPTTAPTTAPTEAPAAQTPAEFPWGLVIGISAAVIVAIAAVVVIIVLKKKKAN